MLVKNPKPFIGGDADPALAARMEVIERLVVLFQLERIVHLGVTTISLVMLLFSAGYLIVRNEADTTILMMLFGSSGLITYSANRLLRMWDQALRVLIKDDNKGNDND